MRVRFEGAIPPLGALYFRGPVLSIFDGREWSPAPPVFTPQQQMRPELRVGGAAVRYEVTLEPHNRNWLLTLDAAANAPELPGEMGSGVRMGDELQWTTAAPITELLRYRASSHTSFRHGPLEAVSGLQRFLALPRGYNPRTLQWAQELRQQTGDDPEVLIDRVLQQLRGGGYVYTLEPGEYGPNSADEFFFDRKEGFCEHIASSFVILMRAAGVPARVVTGYQGGDLNALDGYWVVRQSDAHAWTEVWLAGRGWVRVDPTSAVSPGRIGSLERLTASRGTLASAVDTVSPTLLQNMRAVWEAVNNAWNQRILNYTQGRQFDLLRALGFEAPSWEQLGLLLLGMLVIASLGGAAWTLWERRRQDPWLRLLERVRLQLSRLGLVSDAAMTPREMAQRLAQIRDPQDNRIQAIQAWLRRFEQLRYAPRPRGREAADLADLRRELKNLNWPS
jgi:transglutaminase-like putative cysteine protease